MTQSIQATLSELFDAERNVRRLHDELAVQSGDKLLDALAKAVAEATREEAEDEASLRLVRLAALLGELEGPRSVDLLIDVLGSDHPEARKVAGETLEELAFDRFKEVAKGVERALVRLPSGSPALPELPYILAELPEPGVVKLLGQFLAHADADAVAAGIEAMVELGDPSSVRLIEALLEDTRTIELEGEEPDGEGTEVTIGELAQEALDILSGGEEPGSQLS